MDAIETRLAAARTRLILDHPFLGALVLRLPPKAADPVWCPTLGTDARHLYYNPAYVAQLTLAQTQFMLAHEALHCALSHFARRGHRIRHRWDLACDLAVNPLLVEEGLTPPPQARVLPHFLGMTAEEIYPLIQEDDRSESLDLHAYDGSDRGPEQTPPPSDGQDHQGQTSAGQPQAGRAPPPLTPDQRETLDVQWRQRLAGAAQQARQAGRLGGSLGRLIGALLQPPLPWRQLLHRYLTGLAQDDFSYQRPSRREGDFILPRLRSHQTDLVIGLDTSGSINAQEIQEFVAEVNALKGLVRARVTLLPCDAALAPGSPWTFEPWEEFRAPDQLVGGGGTRFRPVFDWVAEQGARPDLLLYFTDAEGEFPPSEPNFPVLWLVKGPRPVPWGDRVQLN